MKKLLLAAAVMGLAACVNTRSNAVGTADSANAPAPHHGGEAAAATDMEADGAVEVCPVTGPVRKVSQ